MKEKLSIFVQYWNERILRIKKFFIPGCMLTLIYSLGISALIRANFYYIDDIGRAFWGYKEWQYFSRYIPQYFSSFIHADSHLTDISPLPQLIAVVILAISGTIVLYLVTEKDRFSFLEYISMIPLGLSPYFLECLSYKFDSPYMALSILGAVFPLLFYKNSKHGYQYILFVVLGSLVVCTSYQAASGIFPMLVVILILKMWNRKENVREILRFTGLSAAGYIAGMLIYALFLMKPTDTYVSNSVPMILELPYYIVSHLKQYYYYILTDFKKEWIVLIVLLCIGFLFVIVRNSKQKWYSAFFSGVIALILLLVMAFGLYPALEKPIFEPRAMYGFGAAICFIALYAVMHSKTYFTKTVCFLLCWSFFVFGFSYGNALYVQKTYTDYRITSAVDDLDALDILEPDNEKIIQISGTIGRAPGLEAMRQDYQMLNRLVPIMFCDSSYEWGRFGFANYYGLKYIRWEPSIDLQMLDLPVLEESIYHIISGDENYILIELKR